MYNFELSLTPTGRLAIRFSLETGDTVPEEIIIKAIYKDDDDDATGGDGDNPDNPDPTTVTIGPLEFAQGAYENMYFCELTDPLPFQQLMDIEIEFDEVLVHKEEDVYQDYPKRQGELIRQRIYEVLLDGFINNKHQCRIFGDGHYPAGRQYKYVSQTNTTIVIEPGYPTSFSYGSYNQQVQMYQLNIVGIRPVDEQEDNEQFVGEVEDAMTYLLSSDWGLSNFGINQQEIDVSFGQPSYNEEHTLSLYEGNISLPLRKTLK